MVIRKAKEVEESGTGMAKVVIDSVLFTAWCKEKGRQMDTEGRTAFAIVTM